MQNALFVPESCIPNDHSAQSTCFDLLRIRKKSIAVSQVLDLGCGNGDSVDFFRTEFPNCNWIGIDIADSNEVRSRRRQDADFRTFDGVHIPLADASVDVVFCKQVLMNVAEPKALLSEVHRVLQPDGLFVGSTAQIEPGVSSSLWNMTPKGLLNLLEANQMFLHEIRPGIDGLTLMMRRLFWCPRLFDRYFELESPLNRLFDLAGKIRGKKARELNIRKIMFAGHFAFLASNSLK